MIPHIGEILSVACALLWAIAVILFRMAGRAVPATEMNLYKNTLGLILFGLTMAVIPGISTSGFSVYEWSLLIITGILGITIADTLFLKALDLLGASRNAIVGCLYSPFVILYSVFLINEKFTSRQAFGFLLVFTGVILAAYKKPQKQVPSSEFNQGVFVGVSSMALMALGIVMTKPVLVYSSPITVAFVRLIGGAGGGIIWIILSGKTKESIAVFKGKLPWKTMTVGGFLGTYLALLAWIAGYKYTQASTAAILNQTSVFFILILAVIFLKESLDKKKGNRGYPRLYRRHYPDLGY